LSTASPQVASSNSGDCAFEDDTCGWINPEDRDGLDDLNWERMEATKSKILKNFFFCHLFFLTKCKNVGTWQAFAAWYNTYC
jgi:hypothetical protein